MTPDKIRFTCKACGQRIGVSPTRAGMVGKCPRCGKPLVVPTSSERPPTS
ncbi:MAG: hypothetical protein HY720_15415 [Planctomycetes bacterium]|nr:hypothetical protein [Planctomycetota bacterium]